MLESRFNEKVMRMEERELSTPRRTTLKERVWHKHYAIPMEHGSWIWWIGPMLIGLTIAGKPGLDFLLLVVATSTAFLIRQPITLLVKVMSDRRSRSDLTPAFFWIVVYGIISVISVLALIDAGHSRVLWLGAPGIPVFARYLWLVSRRSERRQLQLELLGAGVFALAAPAAYWVAGGKDDGLAWTLWTLTWLQSASSIVHIYLCLQQRPLKTLPSIKARWQMGWRSLAYHTLSLLIGVALAITGWIPWLVPVAFVLMLGNAIWGVVSPAIRAKPSTIGFRQLGFSTLFIVMMILAYRL